MEWNATVRVPTTLNSISVDLGRLNEVPEEGQAAAALAKVGNNWSQQKYAEVRAGLSKIRRQDVCSYSWLILTYFDHLACL